MELTDPENPAMLPHPKAMSPKFNPDDGKNAIFFTKKTHMGVKQIQKCVSTVIF